MRHRDDLEPLPVGVNPVNPTATEVVGDVAPLLARRVCEAVDLPSLDAPDNLVELLVLARGLA
jgi:hypothetical protein